MGNLLVCFFLQTIINIGVNYKISKTDRRKIFFCYSYFEKIKNYAAKGILNLVINICERSVNC